MMHNIPDQQVIYSIGQKIAHSNTVSERTTLIKIYHQIGSALVQVYSTIPSPTFFKNIVLAIQKEYPSIRGINAHNLRTMHKFAKEYTTQDVESLHLYKIPWSHHLILLNTVRDAHARLFYIQSIIKYTWSRTTLINQIQTHLYERHTKVVTNFNNILPRSFAQLAQSFFKHTYFFTVAQIPTTERTLEDALLADIADFLKELGPGFAFMGRQYHMHTAGDDCYIDLLLYNVNLKSYIVIELKNGPFKPEYVGKMHLYIQAVDAQLRQNHDNQTIGLILCKSSSTAGIATLQDAGKPLVVGEYHLKPIRLKQEKRNAQTGGTWKQYTQATCHNILFKIMCLMFIIIIIVLLSQVPLPHGSLCSGSSSSSSSSSSSHNASSTSNDSPSCSKL